jgi:hypothetical protein
MAIRGWLLVLALAAWNAPGAERPRCTPSAKDAERVTVDFEKQVRPILNRCQPCHFEGGRMYGKYPFDKPATVHLLGEKLFTRIKDEQEQAIIRAFLAQDR